jgi:hypothetical protein
MNPYVETIITNAEATLTSECVRSPAAPFKRRSRSAPMSPPNKAASTSRMTISSSKYAGIIRLLRRFPPPLFTKYFAGKKLPSDVILLGLVLFILHWE